MSPPLRPLPGDPGAVRVLAASLRATAERLAAIARTLSRIRDGTGWEGCAGDVFTGRVGDLAPLLLAAAERFGGAVGPLLALADAMEEAQSVIGAAVHDDDLATSTYAVLEDRVVACLSGGGTEDAPEVRVLRHLQELQVEAQVAARARHATAVERFQAVDAQVARSLRSLSLDDLADSPAYRLLAAVSSGGRGLGVLSAAGPFAPELVPVGVAADAAATAADTGLLALYGEGDAGELALSTVLASTAGVGRVLRFGGVARADAAGAGASSARVLTRQQRVAAGVVEAARDRRDALRRAVRTPPGRGTASALLGGPSVRAPLPALTGSVGQRASMMARQAADRAREAATRQLRERVLDDWRLATANGPTAQRMYAAGVTLEAGATASGKVVDPDHGDRDGGGR